jgi:hypothetical protein
VDATTQQRRRLHFTAAMAGVRVRASLMSGGSVRRRQIVQVCSAARLLTALGLRVAVVQPVIPWPRHRTHLLQATNRAGLLGDLALLTAVPRTTVGWAAVADRVLPAGTALRPAAVEQNEAVVCPVAIEYRTAIGRMTAPPSTLAEVVALDGLIIEVRLDPATVGTGRAG